jgi:hypothetical protein
VLLYLILNDGRNKTVSRVIEERDSALETFIKSFTRRVGVLAAVGSGCASQALFPGNEQLNMDKLPSSKNCVSNGYRPLTEETVIMYLRGQSNNVTHHNMNLGLK